MRKAFNKENPQPGIPDRIISSTKEFFKLSKADSGRDIEEDGRRKLLTAFLSLAFIFFLSFGINHIKQGIIQYGIVNLFIAFLFGLIIVLLRVMSHVLILYRFASLIAWLLFFYWVYTGAFDGYSSLWVLAYPTFVYFLLGKREGSIWTALMFGMCLVVFINPWGILSAFEYPYYFIQRHVGTMLVITLFTYYYESVRQKFKKGMEKKQVELQAHKENLEELVNERTREISAKNLDLIKALNEREMMQSRLVQTQKMEALGTLSGGIAHDFNNYLGGIIGSLNMIEYILKRENPTSSDEIRKYLAIGLDSSKRSANLIRRLLALSRSHELSLAPVDITQSINNIKAICKNSFPKSVNLDFQVPDHPLTLMADPVQIEQVLLNLCINGSQAMTMMRQPGEKEGGTLTVKAEVLPPDKGPFEFPHIRNNWVQVEISDTGVGIDGETIDRIFDPFYSTKNSGEGTGLGLSISYSILKMHNGVINVKSEPGTGSVFTVYLPAMDVEIQKPDLHVERNRKIPKPGKILIVDDEVFIIRIVKGILESEGWEVVTATGCSESIAIYKAQWESISVVILDLSMPEMSGLDLFKILIEINPDAAVVLTSGMMDGDVRKAALELGIRDTIHKPFEADELLSLVRNLVS